MKFAETLKGLASSRTVISIAVSMVLKILVAKRVLGADSLSQVDDVTNLVLAAFSLVADGCGVFFRLKATAPGYLTPQYAAHKAWLESGKDRREKPEESKTQDPGQQAPPDCG